MRRAAGFQSADGRLRRVRATVEVARHHLHSHGALLPGRKTEMVRLGPDFRLLESWLQP